MNQAEAVQFMLAGNATFTVVSRATGTRFTYKVSRRDENSPWWRVGLLTGPNNDTDYRYIGSVGWDRANFPAPRFFPPRGTNLRDAPASTRGFAWVLEAAATCDGRWTDAVEFHHAGRCGRCGRTLTTPESVEAGFGPECITRLGE
jgi:hypothetical protein